MTITQTQQIIKGANHAARQADTARSLSGKLYPNGAFSVGTVPKRKKEVVEKRRENLEANTSLSHFVPPNGSGDGGIYFSVDSAQTVEQALEGLDPITLSPVSKRGKTLKTRSRQGKNGLTRHARNMVASAAERLESSAGIRRLSFLTLTVPPLSRGEEALVCSQWGCLVKKFFDWLTYRLKKGGCPSEYVGVTEVQEHRRSRTGEVGLHLHSVFVGRKSQKGHFVVSPSDVRKEWRKILQSAIQRSLKGVPLRIGLELVKKSSASYLSKYISKGAVINGEGGPEGGSVELPARWWHISGNLSRAVRKSIVILCQASCRSLWLAVESGMDRPFMWWSKLCDRGESGGGTRRIICGVVGRCQSTYANQLREETASALAKYELGAT